MTTVTNMSCKTGDFSGTIIHKAKNGVTEFVEFPIEEIDTIFERAQGMVNYYYVCVSFHYCGNGALLVSVSRAGVSSFNYVDEQKFKNIASPALLKLAEDIERTLRGH